MRSYELGVILHPDLEEAAVTQALEKVNGYLQTGGGTVTSVNVWGKRRMTYAIRRKHEGTYAFLQAQLESRAIGELERSLKLDENILRYLLVQSET
jgi:small subunit ribosomal protein S6